MQTIMPPTKIHFSKWNETEPKSDPGSPGRRSTAKFLLAPTQHRHQVKSPESTVVLSA